MSKTKSESTGQRLQMLPLNYSPEMAMGLKGGSKQGEEAGKEGGSQVFNFAFF